MEQTRLLSANCFSILEDFLAPNQFRAFSINSLALEAFGKGIVKSKNI